MSQLLPSYLFFSYGKEIFLANTPPLRMLVLPNPHDATIEPIFRILI